MLSLKYPPWDCAGGPEVKTLPPSAGVWGRMPVRKLRSPVTRGQNTKYEQQKSYCNRFNKGFRNGTHQKKILKNKVPSQLLIYKMLIYLCRGEEFPFTVKWMSYMYFLEGPPQDLYVFCSVNVSIRCAEFSVIPPRGGDPWECISQVNIAEQIEKYFKKYII